MNERELLELAARAVGLKVTHWLENGKAWVYIDGNCFEWNPLTNKADCLQMEIDLRLDAIWHNDGVWTIYGKPGPALAEHIDRQRSSTMAAAAIGRGM